MTPVFMVIARQNAMVRVFMADFLFKGWRLSFQFNGGADGPGQHFGVRKNAFQRYFSEEKTQMNSTRSFLHLWFSKQFRKGALVDV